MISVGDKAVTEIYLGDMPVAAVYQGDKKIWPVGFTTVFTDDFNRSTIGSEWSGSGGAIVDGALSKNASEGQAVYWTTRAFAGKSFDVTALLGYIEDAKQAAEIRLGSPTNYVSVLFSKSAGSIIEHYDGVSRTVQTFGAQSWVAGDTLRVLYDNGSISVHRNGAELISWPSTVLANIPSAQLGLVVNMDTAWLGDWYGPTFDSVELATK